jgi:hypothetical protein
MEICLILLYIVSIRLVLPRHITDEARGVLGTTANVKPEVE